MGDVADLAGDYVAGRWRRGEVGAPTRDALIYTLSTLATVCGDRPVGQLGPAMIDRWLEVIADRAPTTRRNMISRVRGFCRWLVAEGHLRRDPTSHVVQPRVPRRVPVTLSPVQANTVRMAALDLRARVVLGLMLEVGCRCVEVSRLQVHDYDPDGRTVFLRGKADHERVLPVPALVATLLDELLATERLTGGHLIRSRTNPAEGLKAATLSHYVRGWLIDLGVKRRAFDGRSAHGLRRTCGSELMDACGDVQLVQAVLGHARIETTARYYLRPVPATRMREVMALRYAVA